MTSNSNPKPQPTAPGWWWKIDDSGELQIDKIYENGGKLYALFCKLGATKVQWLGPVISHDEGQRLQDEIAGLRKERDGLKDEIELILKHR
jgi:hypothetical protein